MSLILPSVGTSHLLELLSPYAPDDFIAEVFPRQCTAGRRHGLSAAQLWRTHLLAVLTSTHSLNLLLAQLPEQTAWRRFARLRRTLPTARMLHEFRQSVGVGTLRHQSASGGTVVATAGFATSCRGSDGRDGFTSVLSWLQKKAPTLTLLLMQHWAGVRSRRGRAAVTSATRNTRCGCGCPQCIRQ